MAFLKEIRICTKQISKIQYIQCAFYSFGFGFVLGILSKWLDDTPSNGLPDLLQSMDLRNFFSRIAVWLFLAVGIAIYSYTPFSAACNVFVFFTGMLISYYGYSHFISGFFPKAYAFIWVCLTLISPFLGYICWYAKGKGKIAIILSAAILAVIWNATFSFGLVYIEPISFLEMIIFGMTIWILRRSWQETKLLLPIFFLFVLVIKINMPFVF